MADWGINVPSITTLLGESKSTSSPTNGSRPSSPRSRQPSPRPKSKSPMRQTDTSGPARRLSGLRQSGEHPNLHRGYSSRSPVRSPADGSQRSPTSASRSSSSAPNALNKSRPSRLSTVRLSGSNFLGVGSTGSSLLGRRGARPTPVLTEIQDSSPHDGRARSESPTPTPREIVNGAAVQRHLSNEDVHPTEIESSTEKLKRVVGMRKVAVSPRNNIFMGFGRQNNKTTNQRKPRVLSDRPVKSKPNRDIKPDAPSSTKGKDENDEEGSGSKKAGAEIMSKYEPTPSAIREGIAKWVTCTRPEIDPQALVAEDMLDERHSRRQVKCVVWKPDFKHKDAGTKFALKIAIRGKSDVHSWRLFSEKDVMKSLDSPWHTKLVNTFKTDNCLYMLMEYEPLSSIDQYIEGGVGIRPGGLNAVRFYTACALFGIEYMHKRGIVHRDIKPSNFLIDKQGYLKICDYGLSKFLKLGERTNTLLGTVPYLSPELVNEKYYDHGVDIWSLGVSCYEMAYGTTPFEPRGMLNDEEWTRGVESNIRNGHFRLPAGRVGLPARLFVKSLLNRELDNRLGADLNYETIKKHSFFTPLDLFGVQMRTAPPPPVGKPLPKSSRMD